MKWRKALTVLAARSKIDSAAIFDLQGNLMSRTENFAEKQQDINAVLNVLNSSSHLKLIKLSVFGDIFTCVTSLGAGTDAGPNQSGVLLANSEDRLFVAAKTGKSVVVAFSNEEATGSCLYIVTEFCKMLRNRGG